MNKSLVDWATVNENTPLRVVFYGRTACINEAQYEEQIQLYECKANEKSNWHIVEPINTYFDYGKSGNSIDERPCFKRLIEDAKENKFDLIVTKDISRLSRNPLDVIRYSNEFKSLGIQVYFIQEDFRKSSK